MIILALDSGGDDVAVAAMAFDDGDGPGRVLLSARERVGHGHAVRLMPFLLDQLAVEDLPLSAVDLFAVTTGPGSFTGLRVGLAAVAGLALGCDRRIVGVPSFDAMHRTAAPEMRPVLVALDGRRPEPFVQLYDAAGQVLGPAENADAPALARLLHDPSTELCGNGVGLVRALLPAAARHPVRHPGPIDPVAVAAAGHRLRRQAAEGPPAPVYVRPPDAIPMAPRGA